MINKLRINKTNNLQPIPLIEIPINKRFRVRILLNGNDANEKIPAIPMVKGGIYIYNKMEIFGRRT